MGRCMPNLHIVEKQEPPTSVLPLPPVPIRLIIQWIVGVILAWGIGTWLVWWAAYSQRQFTLEEIRAACQRTMPETVERCVDTVIIQRGGARR